MALAPAPRHQRANNEDASEKYKICGFRKVGKVWQNLPKTPFDAIHFYLDKSDSQSVCCDSLEGPSAEHPTTHSHYTFPVHSPSTHF